MLLIAHSFFLSFHTLWRYLIVMPFVAIPGLLVVFAVSALVFGGGIVFLLVFSPVLVGGLLTLIMVFLFTALSCFNIMVGCRAAFGAMGQTNDLDFGRLVGKSMTFTLMQMVLNVFLLIVVVGIIATVFLMSAEGASVDSVMANPQVFAAQISAHPVTVGLMIGATVISLALSALLSVPMAGAAISATPKMGPTDPFLGLGTAFLPVLLVLIATGVLCTATGAYAMSFGLIATVASNLVLLITSEPMIWPPVEFVLLGLAMTLLVIWSSCWFYAASALGWKRFSDDRDAATTAKVSYNRFEPEDLRALREKRDHERGGAGGH